MSDSVHGPSSRAEQSSSSRGTDAPVIPPDIDVAPTVVPKSPASGSPHDPTAVRQRFINSLVGQRLGRYRILSHIGTGGMGTVFLARDEELQREVALKVLPPEFAHDSTIVQRFRNEARAAAQLDHENIARVYDIGEEQGVHYIAFEYVRGETIRELLHKRGRLSVAETVAYALQVATALAHADARGVVHRDIKPSNIIVTTGGRIKLVDMGLARFFEQQKLGGLTQTGVTLGTFDYIAPEQARDPRSADIRSDIYSLGCTLFHMLTGRPPYPDGNVVQKLLQHQTAPPPDVRQFNPQVPRRLAGIVQKMMQKTPEDRYQTATDLITDLFDVAAELNIRPVVFDGSAWAETRQRRSLGFTSALLWLLSLTLLVGIVALLFRPHLALLIPREPISSPSGLSGPLPEAARSVPRGSVPNLPPESPSPQSGPPAVAAAPTRPETSTAPSAPLELRRVQTAAELRKAVREAPDGAIIELAPPNGVLALEPDGRGAQAGVAGVQIRHKRLTIRGGPGQYPIVRLSFRPDAPDVSEWAMFVLEDAEVRFEGLRFELAGEATEGTSLIGFICDTSTLALENCIVVDQTTPPNGDRSQGELSRREPSTGVAGWVLLAGGGYRLGTPNEEDADLARRAAPARITLRRCLFAGGHGFLLGTGPLELDAQHCTWLPYRRPFLLTTPGYAERAAVQRIALRFCTLLTRAEPFFRLTDAGNRGEQPQPGGAKVSAAAVDVRVAESVLAALEGSAAAVVLLPPADVLWHGARNLYVGIRPYAVQVEEGHEAVPLAETFWDWSRLPQVIETDSVEQASGSPWALTQLRDTSGTIVLGGRLLQLRRGTQGFDLAADGGPVGSRFVPPWGELYRPQLAATLDRVLQDLANNLRGQPARAEPSPGTRTTAQQATDQTGAGNRQGVKHEQPHGQPLPPASDNHDSERTAQALIIAPDGRGDYRTLNEALEKAPDGAVLELHTDGPVPLRPVVIKNKRLTLRSAPQRQPVIVPSFDPAHESAAPMVLFSIRNGSLQIEALTVDAETDGLAGSGALTLIQLQDARFVAVRSILRIATERGVLIELTQPEPRRTMSELATEGATGMAPVAGTVSLEHCVLMARDALLRTPAAAIVELSLTHCALWAKTAAVIVPAVEPVGERAALQIRLQQSTLRLQEAFLVATGQGDRPWLAPVEVRAEQSLLVCKGSSAWIQLRANQLLSDHARPTPLRWIGNGNHYALSGPWAVLVEIPEGLGQRSIAASSYQAPPYRAELDTATGSIAFLADSEEGDDVPPAAAARELFTPRQPADEQPVGVDADRLPTPPASPEP